MKLKNNYCNTLKVNAFVSIVLMITLVFLFFAGQQPRRQILNPYQNVKWTIHQQFKANLNTHSLVSDGWENPQSVVENYRKLNYRILAITDNDTVTYPWENFSAYKASSLAFSRIYHLVLKPLEDNSISKDETVFHDVSPSDVGMVAIQGSKLSFEKHDVNSFFSDYNKSDKNVFKAVAAKNGLMVMNHSEKDKFPVGWYVDLYNRYNHLVGMEVFNSISPYQNGRQHWDSILSKMAPERPVWGFSNDNMLSMRDLGENWNVFVLPELDEKGVRSAMEKGTFYFVHAPKGHNGSLPPVIDSIKVNHKKGEIDINASKYDSISWLSEGKKISSGNKFLLKELPENFHYIRAELYGADNSIVCTQPFMIK